jgi:hypothetical protein
MGLISQLFDALAGIVHRVARGAAERAQASGAPHPPRQTTESRTMTNDYKPLDDVIDDLREQIETDVNAGFIDEEDIVEQAVDAFCDQADPAVLEPAARRLTEVALQAHARAQVTWPAETDCDRLDAAFAELEERGIVARQDFSCCNNCGSTEIWSEVREAEEDGRVIHGCTFYHHQDTEVAVNGGGLCLGYQAVADGEEAQVAVGHEIVQVLRTHGFEPRWDGSTEKRIWFPLDWKRRRP